MTSFVDPNFTHHLAVGRILAKVATTLVDRQLLPFNFSRLAWKLSQCQDSLIVKHGEEFAKHGIKVGKVYMHFIRSLDEIQRNHRIINLIFYALSTLSLKKVVIRRQCILLKAEEVFRLLVLFSLSFNLGLKKWLTESRFGTEFLAVKSADSVWRKTKHATNFSLPNLTSKILLASTVVVCCVIAGVYMILFIVRLTWKQRTPFYSIYT